MKRYDNNCILVFGDDHAPYQHKGTLDFLDAVVQEYNPNRIVHSGDLADQYPFSKYPKDPSALSSTDEIRGLRKYVSSLAKMFPKLELLRSNHCERIYSKAMMAGIPREFMKPYNEIIGAPEGWRWHNDLTLTVDATREKIYFVHQKNANTLNLAKSLGMSAVQGHYHNSFGVQHFSNVLKRAWGADVGCLISDEGPPFHYNTQNVFRPMRGCLIIVEGYPINIRMD